MQIGTSLYLDQAYIDSETTRNYILNIIQDAYEYSNYHTFCEQIYFEEELPHEVSEEKYKEICKQFETTHKDKTAAWLWGHYDLPPSHLLVFRQICFRREEQEPFIDTDAIIDEARKNIKTKSIYTESDGSILDDAQRTEVCNTLKAHLIEKLKAAHLWETHITEETRETYNAIIKDFDIEIAYQAGKTFFQVEHE